MIRRTEHGWLASLTKRGSPITTQTEAKKALEALGLWRGDSNEPEAEDAELGLWMISVPEQVGRLLYNRGYYDLTKRDYRIEVETP